MTLTIKTTHSKQILDITLLIAQEIVKANKPATACLLFVKHTTAAITTADLDPGTDLDMLDAFDALMPRLNYRHPHNPEHAPDHILSSIIGPSLVVPIEDGELVLGTWQRIVIIELDGPRNREIQLTFL
jgi:secondary thiamine-phosphate synthase enzyme